MPRKTEVLGVVRNESQMEALVLLHIQRIHDVISVKGDAVVRDRAVKRILEQAHAVFIHIHILKDILQHRRQNVTRIEQLVHTGGIDAPDNAFLAFRMLAVHILSNRFVHRHRKDMLVYFLAIFHLILEEREFLENFRFAEGIGRNVIDRKGKFLISVVTIVVLLLQVVQCLMGHHFLHQLHRRIVLA